MNWTERIENYRHESGFPVSMAIGEDGRMFGTFTLGNDYRSKQGYHGEYPPNYPRRMKALFPDKNAVLHLWCSIHSEGHAAPGSRRCARAGTRSASRRNPRTPP